MKIRNRLLKAFSVFMALSIIIGVAGMVMTFSIAGEAEGLYERYVSGIEALGNMNVATGDMRVGLNRMAFAAMQDDPYMLEMERRDFQDSFDRMDEAYFALFEIVLSGTLEEERDRGFGIRGAYMEAIEVFEARIADTTDGAIITAALADMMDGIDVIRDWMEGMTAMKRVEAHYAHQNAVAIANLSAMTQVALMVAVIAASLVIALRVSGTISRPLAEIGNFAKKVSTGEIEIASVVQNSIDVDSEDEVGELARILESSYVQLNEYERSKFEAESASAAKSNFLSKMSHEIRTPMNAVMGMAEMILRENISDSVRDQAVTIRHSSEHLLSIINDILDFSKIESGKLEIMNSEYLFHSTIHDVITIIKMRMQDSPLKFAAYMAPDLPGALVGDEVRVRQVLINVLSNALKYTKEGHFTLDVTGEVTSPETIMLTMSVKDTGIGIKDEDMASLFDEFAQFDLEKNRNVEGTGLGLAITYNLVRLMGGEIEVNSVYGEGTCFTIRLPQKFTVEAKAYSFQKSVLLYTRTPICAEYAARALRDVGVKYHAVSDKDELQSKLTEEKWDYIFAEGELAYDAEQKAGETAVVMMTDSYEPRESSDFIMLIMPAYYVAVVNVLSGKNMLNFTDINSFEQFIAPEAKILIVDDTPTNLKVGKGLIKPYGMTVDTCISGMEAIEAVQAQNYDLVLMDHMMPEMDGVETVARIRNLPGEKFAKLPIVALTANAIVGAREMFLQNGFNDFLSKPIEINKLNGVLARWLPKAKQKQGSLPPEVVTEPTVLKITIAGVDTVQGILHSGGSLSGYFEVLEIFQKDASQKINWLVECVEKNDWTLYTTYIHAFKSSCANIGARKLSKEAKALEAAGIENNSQFIRENTDCFVEKMKLLLQDIGEVLASRKVRGAAVDGSVMKSELAKLKAALESFDINAIDEASDALKDFTTLQDMNDALSEILQNAFRGKYKQATAQIEELLNVI